MKATLPFFLALFASQSALATTAPTIPEPESLALLAIGAVAMGIAYLRKRKDK